MGNEIALIPCSHLITLCRLTPIRFASAAWLIPASALAFSNVSATRKTQSSIFIHPHFLKILQNSTDFLSFLVYHMLPKFDVESISFSVL